MSTGQTSLFNFKAREKVFTGQTRFLVLMLKVSTGYFFCYNVVIMFGGDRMERAIFAGGCFWCMVQPFEELDGILSVRSGYTGGHVENPTYEQVKAHETGHTEAVEIIFDEEKISYADLVEIYWAQTDPTDAFGQFEDRGDNYRPVIFYGDERQRQIAEQSKAALQASGRFKNPIVTAIEPVQPFYLAEDYHQGFYKKNPEHYAQSSAIRHQFLKENWQ